MPIWTESDFTNTRWVERNLSAVFVGKHGDDRNDGHPRRPVQTVLRATALAITYGQSVQIDGRTYRPIVVSSGIYIENLRVHGQLNAMQVIGDGTVIFEGGGAPSFVGQGQMALRNLTIQNYAIYQAGGDSGSYVENCTLRNFDLLFVTGSTYQSQRLFNCLLINCGRSLMPTTGGAGAYGDTSFINCTMINTRISNTEYFMPVVLQNCYLDATSWVRNNKINLFSVAYCNVQGTINNLTLDEYNTANNNQFSSCISAPPGFNNIAANDYTLALTSPMRNLAADGSFAGAYGVGINFGGQADALTLSNTVWDGVAGGFVLSDINLKGTVEYVTKDLQRNYVLREPVLAGQEDTVDAQTVDAVLSYEVDGSSVAVNTASGSLLAGMIYWVKDYDRITYAGQVYNTNQFFAVNAADLNYTVIGVGKVVRLTETPNIRVFEMKYSLLSAADCNAKSYAYFVFNRVPTIDANGRTNGNPLHDMTTAVAVAARWIRLRVTIFPNSLS